ncbi:hypothetical protein EON65_53540 [archaeon]|nr:MAG: hypothetical protein EON65_53540 [archaeon]
MSLVPLVASRLVMYISSHVNDLLVIKRPPNADIAFLLLFTTLTMETSHRQPSRYRARES